MKREDVDKLAKGKWNLEHLYAYPLFVEMAGAGFTSRLYKGKIPAFPLNLCYYRDGKADWMSRVSDQERIGRFIINLYQTDRKTILELYQRWFKNFNGLLNFYYKNFSLNLSSLNNQQLASWIKNLQVEYRDKVSFPGFLDGFMFYADKRFDFLIKEFCLKNNISSYPQIYAILSSPTRPSFFMEKEKDLQKILLFLRKKSISIEKSLENFSGARNNDVRNRLNNHLFKYSWIKTAYTGYKEYSLRDLAQELKEMSREDIYEKDILLKNKKDKEKILKKYHFTSEILAIMRLTELFAKWQDQRKIYTLTYITLMEKLIKEINSRVKIKKELLRYAKFDELEKILIRKEKKNDLQKRISPCLFVYKRGKTADVIFGKEAIRFFKIVSQLEIKFTGKIKGMVASLGLAKGQAKIVISEKDNKKIKKGDILVSTMTRPEHLPAMKKSAAIVTNEGGITCHAAIVSRELKIPCVIGTKIATKILKDGDLVEVDAERGVVKLIRKAKTK